MGLQTKLTKRIKSKWLEALKSGKYSQVQGGYNMELDEDSNISHEGHCCLAVLDIVAEKEGVELNIGEPMIKGDIYNLMVNTNDAPSDDFVRDYSNVIPTIETLKTVD